MLARAGKYDNCLFHRLVPGFMVLLYSLSRKIGYSCRYRCKQVILLVQALVENHTGELLSETSMT